MVDADIKGAFDNIDHDFLLNALGDVPGRELVRQWLKAGVMEDGAFHATEIGTPQGGVISPLLLNIALHGMEAALGIATTVRAKLPGNVRWSGTQTTSWCFARAEEDALRVKDVLLPPWLAERGLVLSEEKTRIVHLTEGFDFLGFNVKHYPSPLTTRSGYKLLIRPSKKAVVGKRRELRGVWRDSRVTTSRRSAERLNPIIRGWANYHRAAVASKVFADMDIWMHRHIVRYIKHMHPRKSVHLAAQPILGQAESRQERQLGVWRQALTAAPVEVPLVQDRQAHPGAGHGVARRRESAGILVGTAEGQHPLPVP